ncbi:MAG TPA: TIGR02530 family flagellar biosynthesis protein [Solirubrobacteraceae bacterium]|nr:TIGR02530 family flagellar biosynthesis protein [Solirubrobacteraceae bacterium]
MSGIVPNAALVPPGPTATPAAARTTAGGIMPVTGPSFADVLTQSTSSLKAPQFSRHALERIQRRGISVGQATLQRLAGGMSRAATKGSRDAVVFVDSTAFVVSVPNNTVITAVGSEHMREHVFTNIDSAVIA